MAASANPTGNNQEGASNGTGVNNGSSVPHDNAAAGPTEAALRHNPGLAVDWTAEEQSILEDLLNKYASERIVIRYAKIAMQLKDKTVRDVALRCRWMSKKENGKRRKEDHSSARKNKDKKEKITDPMSKSASHAANRSNGPPYAQSMMSMDTDDGIPYTAIGGMTGQLLEQNAQALDQISANLVAFKIHDNINLFCQARNNILSILNEYMCQAFIVAFAQITKTLPVLFG
ncbi:uncharacterized protein LOC127798332 isoform X2 [Diospyros lotus]|uniref:uncharacterized protein LOC127798332 isoform X2 n=1 Tax=Diospyros lotus TaxID=55363 RepID=UPI002251DB20|nr:uncharacterized protein LOC127798332 isoform X2 [Diospyros lotus]